MNIVRKFVTTLADETKRQILADMEKFEHDGFIGESTIRTITTQMMVDELKINDDTHVVMWMDLLVKEIYRVYAYQFLTM